MYIYIYIYIYIYVYYTEQATEMAAKYLQNKNVFLIILKNKRRLL